MEENKNGGMLQALLFGGGSGGGGSGGGSQEPLILTLNPYDIEDFTRGGTYTGATPSAVAEQFMAGRPIFVNFLNVVLIQMTAMSQLDGNLTGFIFQADGDGTSVVILYVSTVSDTFSLRLRALT